MNEPFSKDKIPPQDLAAERTVLGTLLITPGCVADALQKLNADCFHATQNQKIFNCIRDMNRCAIPIDVVSLADELKKREDFEAVGAEPYLSELVQNVATVANVNHHIKILIEKAARRNLILAAENLKTNCFERPDIPARDLAGAFTDAQRGILGGDTREEIPPIVWGAHYLTNGIPDRKPELIGGILRQSHKMLIGAPSKACKSFLAIRLALAIAGGHDWLSGFPCKKGPVYVGNFEVDEGSYLHRVKAVADALKWEMPENIAYHHLRGYGRNIEELFPAIGAAIDGHDFSTVILDPQYKLLRSSEIRNFSENESAAMAYLYGELDRHFSRKGISTILISHFAKGSASGKDSIDRIVGSGMPMRDVDAVCTLTALESDDSYRMEFSLREFKAPDPLSLQWQYPIHTPDAMLDGIPLKKAGGRPGADRGNDDVLVLQAVGGLNGTATQSAVRAALAGNVSKNRVFEALQRLEVSGKLSTTKGGNNATIYHPV